MTNEKETLAEKRGELVGVLTAISAVSKQLARDLTALEHRWEKQTEGGDGDLERLRLAHERIEELEKEKRRRQHKARILGTFIRSLESSPQALAEFDDKVWATSIDRVTVTEDGKLVFRFMDGTEVEG